MSYEIIYFKPDSSGSRQRRCLVLDDQRNWVSDSPAPLAAPRGVTTPLIRSPQEIALVRDAVEFERLPGDALLITHIPQKAQDVMAMFSRDAVCPPVLHALRDAYFAELDALVQDESCPTLDCAQASLIQSYLRRARELLNMPT